MSFVLGLDIGTTSTIGILLELPDRIVATATRPVTLSSPHPGWAEEDPRQWWDNVTEITREILAVSGIKADAIDAIGVTGMLPALVLLDADGQVLRPSIQQSDGRCGQEVAEMKAELDAMQCYIDQSVLLLNAGELTAEDAAAAKLLTSELEARVVDACVQLHGGAGYMEEYRICRMYQDARISRIFGGTSEIMKEIIGRGLGLDDRKLKK